MKSIAQRVQDLTPTINEILRVSGAAGASLGILQPGEIYTQGFGYRDIEARIPPDENTIYHIASLSKSFTAAAIGMLVDEGKCSWDQPLLDILPEFNHPDERIRTETTILDLLAHRTGLATKDAHWQQDGHELLLSHEDLLPTFSYLEVIEPLRCKWIYSNWNYDICASVIEAVSGKSYTEFISDRILKPLRLNDTFLQITTPDHMQVNWAHGYMPGPDCQLTDVGRPVVSAGSIMQGADGIKTTTKDLLTYYSALLEAWKEETADEGRRTRYTISPLRRVADLLTEHIPLDSNSEGQWYGVGWAMADLPAPLGSIGINGRLLPEMPLVGKGSGDKITRVWYHNGSLVGFFSSVHIIPETGTIIVVLVNSTPKNDCADWLGQLLVEEMLGNTEKNDYLALAQQSASAYDRRWTQLEVELEKTTPPHIPNPRPLRMYTGKYYNKPGNWFIEVVEYKGENALGFMFQGRATQSHMLRRQGPGQDCFRWPLTEEMSRHLGRFPDLDVSTYEFNFTTNIEGHVDGLRWVHDLDVPEGEFFSKESTAREADDEL